MLAAVARAATRHCFIQQHASVVSTFAPVAISEGRNGLHAIAHAAHAERVHAAAHCSTSSSAGGCTTPWQQQLLSSHQRRRLSTCAPARKGAAAWEAAIAPPTGQLLVVQPRHRSDLSEALRLAEAYHGRPPAATEVAGHSRATARSTALPTYFGSGAVETLRARIAELEGHPQHAGDGAESDGDGGGGEGDSWLEPGANAAEAAAQRRWAAGDGLGGGGNADQKQCSVFVNASLRPLQERNLSEALSGRRVVDRVGLIIGIFGQRARTREARLQVELASLEHQRSRLVRTAKPRLRTGWGKKGSRGGAADGYDSDEDGGRGRGGSQQRGGFGAGGQLQVVSARQRGASGAAGLGGGGGSGDTELAMQRFRLTRRAAAVRAMLRQVRATRELHRKGRKAAGVPTVAVVGYTNVGKSSLVSALAGCTLDAQDALFVTLDPTARRVSLPCGDVCVLSDTVGFISDLPVGLVEAFRATLEEVVHADVLLHVLDASAPDVEHQRAVVVEVLLGLGVPPLTLTQRTVEVWNKCDLVPVAAARGGAAGAHAVTLYGATEGAAEAAEAAGSEEQSPRSPSSPRPPAGEEGGQAGGAWDGHGTTAWEARWRARPALRRTAAWPRRRTLAAQPLSEPRQQHSFAHLSLPAGASAAGPRRCSAGGAERTHVTAADADTVTAADAGPADVADGGGGGGALRPRLLAERGDQDQGAMAHDQHGMHSDGEAGAADAADAADVPTDMDAATAAALLDAVAARVAAAHAHCPHRPSAVVAASATLGWGHDTILSLVEDRLAAAGLMRGRGAGAAAAR